MPQSSRCAANTGGGYNEAARYAAVAFPAARAIRAAGGQVAAPAVANIDYHWVQELLELGLGDVADVLTCHPYRGDAPETFIPNAATLHDMIDTYTPLNSSLRLSQGEVGYSWQSGGGSWHGHAHRSRDSGETRGADVPLGASQRCPPCDLV